MTRWYQPDRFAWNGDMHGPSTAARLPNGAVVASVGNSRFIFNSAKEARDGMSQPPDVCMDEALAIELRCPLYFNEQCSLDAISWHALGTGIGSEYDTARVLRLMITAKRCRVTLRTIWAGKPPFFQ